MSVLTSNPQSSHENEVGELTNLNTSLNGEEIQIGENVLEEIIRHPSAEFVIDDRRLDTPNKSGFEYYYQKFLPYIYVSVFSIIGCLLRVLVDHLFGENIIGIEESTSVFLKSFASNMLGCYLLGVIHTAPFHKKSFLSIGLATGLCGSLTTLSKWIQQISLLMLSTLNAQDQPQVVAIFAIMVGLLSFIGSYQVGWDSRYLYFAHKKEHQDDQHKTFYTYLHPLCLSSLALEYIILLTIAILFWNVNTFAVSISVSGLLAPFGAMLRHLLNVETPRFNRNNKFHFILNQIPTGTLLANVLGCTAIAVVQSVEVWLPMSCGGKAILFGIQSGFLASLTTVSSFIGEIVALRRQRREKQSAAASYFYIFITVFLCLLVTTVINVINLYFLKQEYYREAMSLPLNITFFEWKHSFTLNCLT